MKEHRSVKLARRNLLKGAAATTAALLLGKPAIAQSKKEIIIGNIDAYSGPAAVYSAIGRTPGAYFKMINEQGGINGRMIKYITYDDAYSPAKTVEQARKLVEGDEIDVLFSPLGAPTNSAIMKYMNLKKVPQLFIASGGTKFGDHKNFPYTMGFMPCYQIEGRAFAQHVLSTQPDAKIGIVYQNDDFGRDVLKGFKDGLGAKASAIVAELSYETADPTIDSQVVRCKSAGANVFMSMTTPKFAAQSIKKIAELGWQPTQYLGNNASSAGSTLKAAGFDISKGIISSAYMKDPVDAAWDSDPAIQRWRAFLDKYDPAAAKNDIYAGHRLCRVPGHDPGAQAVRRRRIVRKHHEAGGEPQGFRMRPAAFRHQDQHVADRLLPARAVAARALQRRTLRGFGTGDRRRHFESVILRPPCR